MPPEGLIVGWDIGGAHVKACLAECGEVIDVAQWACPLWQGLEALGGVLQSARNRWPAVDTARHAVTMTGEMVDLFADREEGVERIASILALQFDGLRFFAGDAGWCSSAGVARHWADIASANWLATARHAALLVRRCGDPAESDGDGVLVDIGSTTTDIIPFRAGRVLTASRSDAERLATGELVYHGVVRTPLCALAPRIGWRGRAHNVMNEWFATTADVYRMTGELDPAHDVQPPADGGAKSLAATRRRLARMIGLDARDAAADEWQGFALAWRARQVTELAGQLRRVKSAHRIGDGAVVVSAGCGDFLVDDVVREAIDPGLAEASQAAIRPAPRHLRYGADLVRIADEAPSGRDGVAAWAQVCAPSVAVAALLGAEAPPSNDNPPREKERLRCGS